jgi:hypothetical protein
MTLIGISKRNVLGVLAALACLTSAPAVLASSGDGAPWSLYGRPGRSGRCRPTDRRFRACAARRSGSPIERFDPGQAAYFSTVVSDGTVFIANLPQTFNQFLPTACTMTVTCFNPAVRPTRLGSRAP